MHLEAFLVDDNPGTLARRALLARLAVPVSLAFLLLIPLQIQAASRIIKANTANQRSRVQAVEIKFNRLQTAISTASSSESLAQALKAIDGPSLSAAERALPLPDLRQRLLPSLNIARGQAIRRIEGPIRPRLQMLFNRTLRNVICALGFSIGFAAAAQRKGSSLSFAMEGVAVLQACWQYTLDFFRPRPATDPEDAANSYNVNVQKNSGPLATLRNAWNECIADLYLIRIWLTDLFWRALHLLQRSALRLVYQLRYQTLYLLATLHAVWDWSLDHLLRRSPPPRDPPSQPFPPPTSPTGKAPLLLYPPQLLPPHNHPQAAPPSTRSGSDKRRS